MDNQGPLFIGTGDSAPKGSNFKERQAVVAVVRDPKTGKYLTLIWNDDGRQTFVTGGIEEGQSAQEAALAEIMEETGYKNFNFFVGRLPNYQAQFYHPQKDVNRHAYFQCFLFELTNDERTTVSQKESDLHTPVWLSLDELRENITEEGPLFLIDYIVKNNL
jgi:8-oxo-dGTP pyrophosphatase MutT (NUDIX family)